MKNSKTDHPVLTDAQRQSSTELVWVDGFSRLLDTKFRIPGTSVRFGADFLLGLVPGIGDMLSMCLSGLLIATMAKNGASAKLVSRMLLNVAIDTLVGSVPILGNFFDLFYKANYRNLELMREYYDDGKHKGSAWKLITGIVVFLVCLLLGTVFLFWLMVKWLLGLGAA